MDGRSLHHLLLDGESSAWYDRGRRDAAANAASAAEAEGPRAEHSLAVELRDALERQRALIECAKELTADRGDPDTMLTLIANQAQRLLPGTFPHDAVALLGSLAALAAIAVEQAQSRYDNDQALEALRHANEALRRRATDAERALAVHSRSVDIVLRGGGVQEVVTAADDQLGGTLAIFDEAGTPVARTPGTAEEALRAMAAAASVAAGRSGRGVQDGTYWLAELVAGSESLGTLVWAPPIAPADVGDPERRLFERVGGLACLLRLFDRNLAAAEARGRGELLDDLLAPAQRTCSSLAERARRIGYQSQRQHAVVVAHIRADHHQHVAFVVSDLAAARDGLSTVRAGQAVLVVPSGDPSSTGRQISRSMTQRLGSPVTVGAAGPVDDPAGLPAAYAEAVSCVHALLRLERAGAVATTADLGYAGLLLGDGSSAAPFVERTLGPVIRHDEQRSTVLIKTLETYFATGQSLAVSAKRLHVHPNTVSQRLGRVKRLLGSDWNSPDHTLEVQLALRLHRLRGSLG